MQSKRKSSRKGYVRNGSKRRRLNEEHLRPPPFIPSVTFRHKFRYAASAAASDSITIAELQSSLVVATSTTTSALLFNAVKLLGLELWAEPPALGAAAQTAYIEWQGTSTTTATDFFPSQMHSAQTMGIEPAHLKLKPPRGSLASFWLSAFLTNRTDKLFNYVLPVGTVIEFDLLCVLQDANDGAISGPSTSGASTGKIYGVSGDANLVPIGLTALP